jgi:serine/threonine protein phosphatase PrpC
MKTSSPTIEIFAKTIIGMVRDHNEDNLLVGSNWQQGQWLTKEDWEKLGGQAPFTNPPGGVLMLVADGMGGANAGEIASQLAAEAIREYFSQSVAKQIDVNRAEEALKKSILFAHERIVEHAIQNPDTEGMGTTLVVAWVNGQTATIAWSGDSRAYLYRAGVGLRQLSKDHSYVQSLVDQGELTPEQANYHPQSNVILQSLGDPQRAPQPSTLRVDLQQGDYLLLCSDGLNGMLTDGEMAEIMAGQLADGLAEVVRSLVRAANEAGGHDNISVVAAYVHEADPLSSEAGEPFIWAKNEEVLTKKNNKFLLPLLLVLAVLLGALGSWYFVDWVSPERKTSSPEEVNPLLNSSPTGQGQDADRKGTNTGHSGTTGSGTTNSSLPKTPKIDPSRKENKQPQDEKPQPNKEDTSEVKKDKSEANVQPWQLQGIEPNAPNKPEGDGKSDKGSINNVNKATEVLKKQIEEKKISDSIDTLKKIKGKPKTPKKNQP